MVVFFYIRTRRTIVENWVFGTTSGVGIMLKELVIIPGDSNVCFEKFVVNISVIYQICARLTVSESQALTWQRIHLVGQN